MAPFGTATRRDGAHIAHYGVSLHSGIDNTLRSSFLVLTRMDSRRWDLINVNRPSFQCAKNGSISGNTKLQQQQNADIFAIISTQNFIAGGDSINCTRVGVAFGENESDGT